MDIREVLCFVGKGESFEDNIRDVFNDNRYLRFCLLCISQVLAALSILRSLFVIVLASPAAR